MSPSNTCQSCGCLIPAIEQGRGSRSTCASCRQNQPARLANPGQGTLTSGATNTLQKRMGVQFGHIALAAELIFLVGIILKPGSFEAVMYGGILGLAGLVMAIIAAATGRGRWCGVAALGAFVLAWAINSVIIGRL